MFDRWFWTLRVWLRCDADQRRKQRHVCVRAAAPPPLTFALRLLVYAAARFTCLYGARLSPAPARFCLRCLPHIFYAISLLPPFIFDLGLP